MATGDKEGWKYFTIALKEIKGLQIAYTKQQS